MNKPHVTCKKRPHRGEKEREAKKKKKKKKRRHAGVSHEQRITRNRFALANAPTAEQRGGEGSRDRGRVQTIRERVESMREGGSIGERYS